MKKISVGIAGGAGYTGGELLRLLLLHPSLTIKWVQSKSQAGKKISTTHTDLLGETDLVFIDQPNHDDQVDVVFLCMGHGEAKKFLDEQPIKPHTAIIDLSQDFRLQKDHEYQGREFVYGLPEANREAIQTAHNIANPGCFATAIQLALLPVAAAGKLPAEVHINAVTGSTGAGQSLSATSHFSWRFGNQSTYKIFAHQHLNEIGETMHQLQPNFEGELLFVPQRGAFTRGILATVYFNWADSLDAIKQLYRDYYEGHPFIRISEQEIDLKQVVNTNRCFLHLQQHGNRVVVTSIIDNLLKGAAGQAVQNMNLLFGLDETTGLHLKPSAF